MSSPRHREGSPASPGEAERHSLSRPSLLPAFDPASSSPGHPRPRKRNHDGSPVNRRLDFKQYPTPVPTSSTGILQSSSPSRVATTRPGLKRSTSTMSERIPLGAVPTVDLPLNSDPVLMGRSSNSSHYQLSANRLISRVHVRAEYVQPVSEGDQGKVFIKCLGWNGAIVHCRGQKFNLAKGDTFSSDKPLADIMLDVQDARVLLRWPEVLRKDSATASPEGASEDEQHSPPAALTPPASSPPQIHLRSPVSPSPRGRPSPLNATSTFLGLPAPSSPDLPAVEIYEDENEVDHSERSAPAPITLAPTATSELATEIAARPLSSSSSLSEPVDDLSDHNEENDPVVHSFGPGGGNILPRLASITAASPEHRQPLRPSISPRQRPASTRVSPGKSSDDPRGNHVINQLAYSRLHSLPLSTILNNLPPSLKLSDTSDALTLSDLKLLLEHIPCVGLIAREGKDAAGKALEDEFYYIPEMDSDLGRRETVTSSLGKSGLRSVRKQHKQYFWKRPRN